MKLLPDLSLFITWYKKSNTAYFSCNDVLYDTKNPNNWFSKPSNIHMFQNTSLDNSILL